jgi:hypothetical protein
MAPDINKIPADRQLVPAWYFRDEVMRCRLHGYSLVLPRGLLVPFITSQPHKVGRGLNCVHVAKPLRDAPYQNPHAGRAQRRRPDVSASEDRLHAATERIGMATADLFPRVSSAGLLRLNELHGDTPFDGVSAVNLAALNID